MDVDFKLLVCDDIISQGIVDYTTVPFLGRNVKPAFLTWVAAESLDELFPRAQAWLLCHNRSTDEALPMLVLEERMPLNDLAETETFILSMNAQLAEMQVTPQTHSLLIVFDTYSKCTPGSDENNTKDVKGIVEQIDRVHTLMNGVNPKDRFTSECTRPGDLSYQRGWDGQGQQSSARWRRCGLDGRERSRNDPLNQ
jgi:AAA domain